MGFFPPTTTVDPQNRALNVILATSIGSGFALAFLSTRVAVKVRMTRAGVTLDDWMLFAAMLTSLAMSSLAIAMIHYGLGFHTEDLHLTSIDSFIVYSKMFYSIQIIYTNGPTFIKASILILLLRVFPELRRCILITLVFISLLSISCTIALVFQCVPVSMIFDLYSTGDMYCIDSAAVYYAHSAGNIVSDFVMYVLPMQTFYNLHLHRNQRLGLLLVFGIGGLVVGAGVMRLAVFIRAFTSNEGKHDPFWLHVPCILWSTVELNVGIICACLTCMKPLIDRVIGRTQKSPDMMYCYDDGESVSFNFSRISRDGRGPPIML